MSSRFGLVRTVENRGYLYATRARGPLYPTQRLLSLARAIAAHDPLTSRIASTLGALRDTCGETVVVGKILAQAEAVAPGTAAVARVDGRPT